MSFGKTASAPPVTPLPPPPSAPTLASASSSSQAGSIVRGMAGLGSTLLTSPTGLTDQASTTRKSLLGQ